MRMQNLIIYKFTSLYSILKELELDLNFKISFTDSEKFLKDKVKNFSNYLIISNKKYLEFDNQFILGNTPIRFSKLVEKINIEFLRLQFHSQSQVKIKNYTMDMNSREIIINDIKLKLTEKEINTIIYLLKSNKPVSIDELQKKVWSYQSDIESHTVETHIYRLRKKFLSTFNDEEFIVSKRNGYQIK